MFNNFGLFKPKMLTEAESHLKCYLEETYGVEILCVGKAFITCYKGRAFNFSYRLETVKKLLENEKKELIEKVIEGCRGLGLDEEIIEKELKKKEEPEEVKEDIKEEDKEETEVGE